MSTLLQCRRTWYRLLGVGPLVLLFALLPSVSYLDHWGEYLRYTVSGEEAHPFEHATHQQHCHYGPSTCSDQPVPVNVRVLPAVVELPRPELRAFVLTDATVALEELFVTPRTEPPRL